MWLWTGCKKRPLPQSSSRVARPNVEKLQATLYYQFPTKQILNQNINFKHALKNKSVIKKQKNKNIFVLNTKNLGLNNKKDYIGKKVYQKYIVDFGKKDKVWQQIVISKD